MCQMQARPSKPMGRCQRRRTRMFAAAPRGGFTIIELMVTIAVAAVLLAIAVPSFKAVMARTNIGGVHNEMLSALRFARTEAVSRAANVTVTADAAGWTKGWKIEDQGGVVLREHGPLADGYVVTASPTGTMGIGFQPNGSSNHACFTISSPDGAAPSRHLAILPSGSIHSAGSCP